MTSRRPATDERPDPAAAIGVIDSGIGGLTVLRDIVRALPYEDTVYMGDTARVPYGAKSADTVIRYALEISAVLRRERLKALVVACNTMSAVALDVLRERLPVVVVGVIEPGAAAAVRGTRSGHVAVIGTEATVRSGAYEKAIAARDARVRVTSIACPLFVPLAEEGWTDNEVARLVAEEYLGPLRGTSVDTLVLGCTHYPLLKGVVRRVVGEGVALVDSAEETAGAVAHRLAAEGLRRPAPADATAMSARRVFYATDVTPRFSEIAHRFFGASIDAVTPIEIP